MARGSKRQSQFHGLLVVDKPSGMTSQDVVNIVRRVTGTRRVGHTGTLDPLATGLLLVLVGEATKLSEYMVGFSKVYEGTMRLGVVSDTYDIEGAVEETGAPIPTDLGVLQRHAATFRGEIEQFPPAYSAVKVRGKKLYEYARAGESVDVESRIVTIHGCDVLVLKGNEATFRVHCTSGTYVRSLVHELGQMAGCGAVVSSLRRTAAEDFTIEESVTLDQLEQDGTEGIPERLLPMIDTVTAWPVYYANADTIRWTLRGQAIPILLAERAPDSEPARIDGTVFLCPLGGDAVAVARVVPAPPSKPPAELSRYVGPWLQPLKLLQSTQET